MSMVMPNDWRNYRDQTLGFGKHRDLAWKDVPAEYLDWLSSQFPRQVDGQVPIIRTRRAWQARSELLYRSVK